MALTTLDGVLTALTVAQRANYIKTLPSLGTWGSSWLSPGGTPAAASTPSSGVAGDIPTSATAGAIPFVNPSSGLTYLARVEGMTLQTNALAPPFYLALYDRLWHNSGLSISSTSAQTVGSPTLTRGNANGAGVEAWWENYTGKDFGPSPTGTVAYTDQDGNLETTGTTGVFDTSSRFAGCVVPIQLATGDTGVRSIQTWTANATFGTSGSFGLVLRKLLTSFMFDKPNMLHQFDEFSVVMPRIYDDACLEFLWYPMPSQTTPVNLTLSLVQG
jgi:hypothetical protein